MSLRRSGHQLVAFRLKIVKPRTAGLNDRISCPWPFAMTMRVAAIRVNDKDIRPSAQCEESSVGRGVVRVPFSFDWSGASPSKRKFEKF